MPDSQLPERGSVLHRIRTRVLVFAGTHSVTARRWIMARAWDDLHRRREADCPKCHAPQECPTPDMCSDFEECSWPR